VTSCFNSKVNTKHGKLDSAVERVNGDQSERPILGELQNTRKLKGGAKSKTTLFLHVAMSNEKLQDCLLFRTRSNVPGRPAQ